MLYMVIERFKAGAAAQIYARAGHDGRMLPEGLHYLSSWVDLEFERCYQLMETQRPELFEEWIEAWSDLAEFEIVAVRTSAEAAQIMAAPRPAGDGPGDAR